MVIWLVVTLLVGDKLIPRKFTPGSGEIMFAYRIGLERPDYTVVVAIMPSPQRITLVLKHTLVVEIPLLLCRQPPLIERSLRLSLPEKLAALTGPQVSDHKP